MLVGLCRRDLAEVVRSLRGEVALRSSHFGAGLGSVQTDLGALHAGTSHSVGLFGGRAARVCLTTLEGDLGHLEVEVGGVDRHAGLAGSVAKLWSVNAGSTAERARGKFGAEDVEVLLGAGSAEGTLGCEGVEFDVRLVVAERPVLVEGWAAGGFVAGCPFADVGTVA